MPRILNKLNASDLKGTFKRLPNGATSRVYSGYFCLFLDEREKRPRLPNVITLLRLYTPCTYGYWSYNLQGFLRCARMRN